MCSKTAAKVILIVINSAFVLFGAVSVGLGIFVLADKSQLTGILSRVPSSYTDTVDDVISKTSLLEDSAIALICAGGVIFILSALGFFGALKGNKIMLYVYAIVILLIFCCEIAAGIMGYFYKDRLDTYFQNFLNDTISEKYSSGTFSSGSDSGAYIENVEPVSAAWDFTMTYFQCCGNYNYTDFSMYATNWNSTTTYNDSSNNEVTITAVVPMTCCKTTAASSFPTNLQFVDMADCLVNGSSTTTNHENCYDKLKDLFTTYSYICLGVGIGIAFIELTGILAACCLVRALSKDD